MNTRSRTGHQYSGPGEAGERAGDPPTNIPTNDDIVRVAILRFAGEGFDAPLRAIADDAGASAALVMKRFGSKEGLRAACDEAVHAWIREVKQENMEAAAGGQFLDRLQGAEEYAPLLGYCLQSVRAGGELGRAFVEHMIEDADRYTQDAVDRGIILPSVDPRARVRYLVMSSLGSFLLDLMLDPPAPGETLADRSRTIQADSMMPMLELFSQGLFADRRMLDDYLMQVPDPPGTPHPSEGHASRPTPPGTS